MRYSLDINPTDDRFEPFRGSGAKNAVKVGDKVARGQPVARIGRIGSSGSSHNPHLHYELRTGKDLDAEGLPAVFRDFNRHLGSKVLPVSASPVDTGDLLETR